MVEHRDKTRSRQENRHSWNLSGVVQHPGCARGSTPRATDGHERHSSASGLKGGLAIAEAEPQFRLSRSGFSSYHRQMTKLLEQAIEAVRRLPADSQDDIARTILHLAGSEEEAEPIDPAHLAAVLEGFAKATRREFAARDEVEAAFRCFDR
jgi:hypothetical protein